MKPVEIFGKENTKKAIIAIGQELIRRSDDICNDLDFVGSISISAELLPTEIANFNINKNYIARFKEEENNEI